MEPSLPLLSRKKILFYDGDCGFCQRCLRFLLRFGRDESLFYAPLQGPTAAALLGPTAAESPTLLLFDGGRIYSKSTAALGLAARLSPWLRLPLALLWIVPRPLRDEAYDFIAKRRHLLAGSSACPSPSPEQRRKFLR